MQGGRWSGSSAASGSPVLVFYAGGVRFGIAAANVVEAARATAVSALPNAPGIVEGIVDFRGTMIAVLNFRARFGLPEKALDPSQRFVVVRAGDRIVAMRVDDVHAIEVLDAGAIEKPPVDLPHVGRVAGIARTHDGLLLVHDPAAFLDEAESAELDVALREATA